MNRRDKQIGAALAVFCGAAGFFYGCVVPFREGRQVRTCTNMQILRRLLDSYRQKHGDYPTKIQEAVAASDLSAEARAYFAQRLDLWGNPLHYERRTGGYILVSYGRDGVPDGLDYWSLRDTRTSLRGTGPEYWRVCKDSRVDLIASDTLFHRCCGK